jgi:hypothetical protein
MAIGIKSFITTGAAYGCLAEGGTGIDKEIKEFFKNLQGGNPNGVFCSPVDEPVPTHEKAACEIVYPGMQSPHNTFIVLGRDRPGSFASGAGGKGRTQSGMIDIVVGKGHMSAAAALNKFGSGPCLEYPDSNQAMGPSFINDAARIYLTQQCLGTQDDGEEGGIDSYFGLPESLAIDSGGKSAIGIKADHTRIIGRESVRIYAGSARNMEGSKVGKGENNSMGNRLDKPRIELIAGNKGDLQPVVLGTNLKEYLTEQSKKINEIIDDIRDLHDNLAVVNGIFGVLLPTGAFLGKSLKNLVSSLSQWPKQVDGIITDVNYIDKVDIKGGASILSSTVFTT